MFLKTLQNSQKNVFAGVPFLMKLQAGNLKLSSSYWRCSVKKVFCKKMFLKVLQNSQKNVFAGVSFLIKLQAGNMKLSEAATGDVL